MFQRSLTGSGVALAVVILVSCGCEWPAASDAPFTVVHEYGRREAVTGFHVAYDVIYPAVGKGGEGPFPGIVLTHGFARNKKFHRETAQDLAARGFVVMTPNMISLLQGEPAQLRNVDALAGHVAWLRTRANDANDPLHGVLDPARIALVGHSAGGAVSFEAAVKLADGGEAVQGLALLDAVPWSRTITLAGDLPAMAAASFRSEPGDCNANGQVLDLLGAMAFSVSDVRIVGATHCDPESPTNIICRLPCGGTSDDARKTYRVLLHAFLADALGGRGPEDGVTYADRLAALTEGGEIVRDGDAADG